MNEVVTKRRRRLIGGYRNIGFAAPDHLVQALDEKYPSYGERSKVLRQLMAQHLFPNGIFCSVTDCWHFAVNPELVNPEARKCSYHFGVG